ncbi:sialic acid-binding Ig-like lectin 10 [Colossoma macropomum]|uniref:sialic acid-binding Ig-like lectin 10 n=1 Tax=Colossoma macropomum TaxID=42526 RepID=UPI0018649B80|nr:sialic acid-binding Ig-like lectin 10 [Colossoma macropomum]
MWRKDGTTEDQTVFDSTTPENNKIKGEITGDLRMKDCTTIFNSVNKGDSGRYYFRIESGELKYTYTTASVYINVSDSPPKPTLSLYRDQMEVQDRRMLEGSSVSLFCSAFSPCPTQPPTLSWSPLPTNSSQEQNQNTSFISSQLNFITTHLHHKLRFNCTATYQLENNDIKTTQRSVVLRVLYAPRNTSVSVSSSGPVMFGSSVTLNCSSDGNPAVNYTWYRENGEQIETGPSLTITETDDTHSGVYYCRAQNQHGAQNSSVQLDIQYAPRNTCVSVSIWSSDVGQFKVSELPNTCVSVSIWSNAPKNTSVSVSPSGPVMGRSVSLNCSSDGNPAVNYNWYRENGEQVETGPSLTINKTDDTHSGLYYCRAQNQHGVQNSSVQLDIQYAPKNTSVSVSPSGPVMLGSSGSLNCSSDGNPAVNYTWYRENGEQIETGPSFTITETDDAHSGLYYCRAQNQHGAQNSSVQLDIQYAPRKTSVSVSPSGPVMLGRSVTLNCSSDGNPAVNYTWYRENGEQIETGPSLTINKTDDTHSGLYYCRAQNQHGAQNSSVQLDIQYAPKDVLVSPSGPVMLDSSVTLNCSSDGNPAVNYTWYRENGEQIETGPSLTINKTDDTHSGLYYCRAQNQHGAQNSSVQLDIQYAPQNDLFFHCNSSSEGGIVCVCEVHGRPVPKLEWRLSDQAVPPSENSSVREESVGRTGLRSLIYIHQSCTGTLQCISTNRLGSTSQLFYSVATHHCSSAGPFHILSILVGAAVGASAVMILCAIFLCRRRAHHKPTKEETEGLVLSDRAVCQEEEEVESIYANKNMLSSTSKLPLIRNNPDSLHYSTIYFPNGKEGSGEIRGLSSLTPEYATIRQSSRKDPERETTEAQNSAATEEEQTKPETVSGEEIIQPANEETTYGNIVRHKTPQSDLDPGVEKEQSETKPTDPEQLTDVDGAEGVYAQVKHQKQEPKVSKC